MSLNFLQGYIDPRITFTRASGGWRTNPSGLLELVGVDTPRLDYDPVTLQPKGLLIEGARTNLLLWSNEFTNVAWSKVGCTLSAGQVGAASASSATRLIESLVSEYHRLEQSVSYTAGQAYTFSCIARSNGNPIFSLTLNGAGAFSPNPPRVYYDLSTGAVGVQQNLGVGAIISIGGGRYLCSITATPATTATGVVQIGTHEVDGVLLHTGDGVSGAFVEAAQLEAGAFATSYIPTTAAAVTRAADLAVMTGANFSNWFNPVEGTFVVEASVFSTASNRGVFSASDGTASNEIFQYVSTAANNLITAGSVAQANIFVAGAVSSNVTFKDAFAYRSNDIIAAVNGTIGAADTSATIPTVNRIRLGARGDGSFEIFGHIRRLDYYRTRLSNADLQRLTA